MAFLKYNNIVYASATPANSQASLEAKNNGKPYGKLITTTPGDLQTEHGVWARKFFDGAYDFYEGMYDEDIDYVKEIIQKNSRNNFVFIQFTYKQIGRSEEWYRDQCQALDMDRFKIKREILLDWTKSSDMAVFSESELDRLYSNIKEPIAKIMLKNFYKLDILQDINFSDNFIISVDCATGLSQDYSVICVSNPARNMEVVAQFRSNTIDTIELAEVIYELAKRYIRFGPVVIERNSVGKSVIDYLLKTDISNRLYYEYKEITAERRLNEGTVQRSKTKTKVYGVNTDKDTRPKMIDILRHVVSENYEYVNSKELVDEIASLERGKKGKIEHSATSHDDMVFAYLVGCYVWTYGNRLSEFGIFKKNRIGDNGGSVMEILNEREANEDFIRKFNSISRYNKDYDRNSSSISAHSIIEDYNIRRQHQYELEREEKVLHKNSILKSIEEMYNR